MTGYILSPVSIYPYGVAFPEFGLEILQAQLKKAFPIINKDGMEEVKAIKTNLTKKEKEIELIEFNLATATDAKTKDICSRQLEKVEAERDEILLQLEERDKSILNLYPKMNLCFYLGSVEIYCG